jgi:hypothetical protein
VRAWEATSAVAINIQRMSVFMSAPIEPELGQKAKLSILRSFEKHSKR